MGFGLSVRRLVTEIIELSHLKFAENRKITFFLQQPLKLNSEIFYCHRTSSFNVSHRFLGGGNQTFFFRAALGGGAAIATLARARAVCCGPALTDFGW